MFKELLALPKMLTTASVLVAASVSAAHSENINFLCPSALRPAMELLVAEFQRVGGHTLNVTYANIGNITNRVLKGESVDLSVTSPEQWQSLQQDGKIAPDFKVQFAKVGIGLAVKKGSTKPDLSSSDAVKRTLLNARAIAFADPAHGAPSGEDALRLFARLGIAAEMKPKSKLFPGTAEAIQAVAEGDADFGIMHASVIAMAPKVELADSLPADLQNFTIYVASIPKSAKQVDPAKSFVKFLTSPNAAAVLKAKGLEPG